jgi:signal transduction histidine kinase
MQLQLQATKEAPRISRAHLQDLEEELKPRNEDVALIISELVSNSVRHSSGPEVEVTIELSADSIRIEVRDSGPCFSADVDRADGLGLKIVEKLSSAWGIDGTDGCRVWAELAR